MFLLILTVVVMVAYLVIVWAMLGERMRGRNLGLMLAWAAAAVLVRWASGEFHLHPGLGLTGFVLVLGAGYYHLQRLNPNPRRRGARQPARAGGKKGRGRHRARHGRH